MKSLNKWWPNSKLHSIIFDQILLQPSLNLMSNEFLIALIYLTKPSAKSDSSWHEPHDDLSDVYWDDSDGSDENLSDFLENRGQNGADEMEFEEIPAAATETNESALLKNLKQNYCNLI